MTSRFAQFCALCTRPSSPVIRYIFCAVVVLSIISWVSLGPTIRPVAIKSRPYAPGQLRQAPPPASSRPREHPIDTLIARAEDEFNGLLAQETTDLPSTAARYRARRGRHPPPGFDVWYEYAREHDALMVEEFFDQIYHDLNPFWGVEPRQIRAEARDFPEVVKIRGHSASTRSESDAPWMRLWGDMIKTLEEHLPDMDLAINVMDESRLVAPWEKINEYMEAEKASRKLIAKPEALQEYMGTCIEVELLSTAVADHVEGLEESDKEPSSSTPIEWDGMSVYFDIARRGCHPDSPARQAETMKDWSRQPRLSLFFAAQHMYQGYVSNWTLATSICEQPDLQSLHGTFIEPTSTSSSDRLIPMFGGSKLATNNEILLPPAMYWSHDKRYAGDGFQGHTWEEKRNTVIWRGAATGGRNKVDTWMGFQRHRFVAMMNGTQVARAENWTEIPRSFELPPQSYQLKAADAGRLGEWVGSFGDAAFMDLLCWTPEPKGRCRYTGPYYEVAPAMPMKKQFECKYLPDIDGNSFSGRYRGFLRSNSLPIKATIYKEWHDSRLVAWKHFVPMDNRFIDIYGIMEYFLGAADFGAGGPDNSTQGHDEVAKTIALAGQDWARRVLRPEDMQIYVFRLLLEYARVSDDNRHRLAFVADLDD